MICVGEVELFRSPLVERQLTVHVGAGSGRCGTACGRDSSRNSSIARRARQSCRAATRTYMPYGIMHCVTCHPAEVTFPTLPRTETGILFNDPGMMQN